MSSLNKSSQHAKNIALKAMDAALEARDEARRLAEEYIVAEGLHQIEHTFLILEGINPKETSLSYFKALCNQILNHSDLLFVKHLICIAKETYKEKEDLTKISNSFQLIQSVSNLLGVPAEEIFDYVDMNEVSESFNLDSIGVDCFYETLDIFINSGETPGSFSFCYQPDFIASLIKVSDSLKFTDEIITSIIELIKKSTVRYCVDSIFIFKLLEKMSNETSNITLLFKMIGLAYHKPEYDVPINFTLPKGAKFNFSHLKEVLQVDSLYDIEKSWQKTVIKHLLLLDLIEEELALEIKLTDLVDKLSVLISEKVSITLA